LESGAFLKTRPELEVPDIQLHFVAAMMRDHARMKSDRHGFTVHVCQLRPESRGYIGLKSTNPADHALIQPNYLEAEYDRKVMRDGVRIVREIISQRAMDAYRGPEDRKSTRLNSSHVTISYAVFCLKKKIKR